MFAALASDFGARSSVIDPQGLRLLLVRHAATAWNDAGRYVGQADVPLSRSGRDHAMQLQAWLASESVDVVLHSGAQCSVETLHCALPSLTMPIYTDPRWLDWHYGDWQGLTYHDLLTHHAAAARAFWADPWQNAPPQGETLYAVSQRVEPAVRDLVAKHAGKTVLLIAHATSLQLALCHLLQTPPTTYWRWKLDLASLSCVQLYASGTIINWLNRGYHMPPAC